MIRTPLCDLLGIDSPIIQAPAAPYVSPELVAVVSNAGGLGSYPTGLTSLEQVQRDVERIKELTDRPFAINFLMRSFEPEAFDYAISENPAVISFAAGLPEPLIKRARDAGSRVLVQIQTVELARRAADLGVDAIVAQGTEAGGLTGRVSLMPLLPQVVDAVAPIPVIAAGGIADGRGMAAALILGAQGVNIGTRFLASSEARMDQQGRDNFIAARSEDTVLAEIMDDIFPPPEDSLPLTMRSLRTPFLREWEARPGPTGDELDALRSEVMDAIQSGRMFELAAGAGESVGMVASIEPAAEILRRMLAEAEAALARAPGFTGLSD